MSLFIRNRRFFDFLLGETSEVGFIRERWEVSHFPLEIVTMPVGLVMFTLKVARFKRGETGHAGILESGHAQDFFA